MISGLVGVEGSQGLGLAEGPAGSGLLLGVPLSKAGCGRKHNPLTFGAEVQTLHVEDPTPQGNLLKDDTKAVDVAGLGAPGWG